MSNEFEPMIITVEDDDGTEYQFEIIDEADFNDEHYLALLPVEDKEDLINEPEELVILKVIIEDGEEVFVTIDDDDEADDVADFFIDRLENLYEIEEED